MVHLLGIFLGFAVAYSIVEVGPGRLLVFHGLLDLPHSHFVNLIVDHSLDDISLALTSEMLRIVATMHFSMIFGLLGGCLALWRYRRLERREQQKSP